MGLRLKLRPSQSLVRAALSVHGRSTRSHTTRSYRGAGLARLRMNQLIWRQGGHLHMQVNAVHQRAAQAALVAGDLFGCAFAGPLDVVL